jgi:hypothetical protein
LEIQEGGFRLKSKELIDLILSPQWTGKLLHHFFCGAQLINPQGIKTELLYLVLPLLIDDITRKCIRTNIKSSFFTCFIKNSSLKENELLELKNAVLRKNNQTNEYREFTNRGLIYLGNIFKISTGQRMTIEAIIRYQDEPVNIREHCKAAYYLGVIFAKEDHLNIFLKLGIINI